MLSCSGMKASMGFNLLFRHVAAGHARASLLGAALILMNSGPSAASFKQKPADTSEPAEMLITQQGLLAIDSPKGWVRTDGPGLAYFVPQTDGPGPSLVWIYISSALVGPNEESEDLKSYVASDIAAFKKRFSKGTVQEEAALSLPHAEIQAPVVMFQSGEKRNSMEQVVYIGDGTRVLTLVLSAKEKSAVEKALPTFRDFALSYRGSLTTTSN